jgi:tetratricopeptide (TPR) repeat protein
MNDLKGIAECYISLGIVYQRTGKIQVAISYYQKALSYFVKTKNEKVIGAISTNIGTAYNDQGKLDSALFFLKKVIISKQKLNDHIGLAKAYHNIATTYSYLGKFEQSLNYYNMALKSSGGGENNSNNGITYEAASAVLLKLNKLDEAEKYLLKCKKIYLDNGIINNLVNCYEKLVTLYEQKSDFTKSVKYITLMNQLNDSLLQLSSESSFAEIEAKYKAIEKTHENELLIAKNHLLEQDSKHNKILGVCLLIVFVISLVLAFYLSEVRKTKNKLLQQNELIESKNTNAVLQNEKLEQLVDENQTLMGVLAHDLRSPFNKIIGLTNLLENDLDATIEEKILYFNFINSICKDSVQLIQDTINLSEIFHLKNLDNIIKKENISSNEIQTEMVNSFKVITLEKGIEIVTNNDQENFVIHNSKEYLK